MKFFVEKIVADKWEGVFTENEIIAAPTENDAKRVIEALDANIHTLVCFGDEGALHMVVGGGNGNYVVYAAFSGQEFWNLISDTSESRKILINAGGQEGDYPVRQVVKKPQVLQAAMTFFRSGKLDETLRWEKQEN